VFIHGQTANTGTRITLFSAHCITQQSKVWSECHSVTAWNVPAVTSDGQGAFSDIGKAGEFHSGRWVGKPCYYCLMVFAYSFCVFVLSDASVGKWSVRFISESDLYLGPWADGPQAHTDSPSVWHRLPFVRSRWPFSCFCWYVHDICWLNSKLEAPVFNILQSIIICFNSE